MVEHMRVRVTLRTWAVVGLAAAAVVLPPAPAAAQTGLPEGALAACTVCHVGVGAAAAPNFAKLDGLSEAYILKQLRDYRSGRRKSESEIMGVAASGLKRHELRTVSAHFAGIPRVPGTTEDAEAAARGKALYEGGNPTKGIPNCIGCHGPNDGSGPLYPVLAGQLTSYTIQELNAFRSGSRQNDRARVMRGIASLMTDDEIKAVADYIRALPVVR